MRMESYHWQKSQPLAEDYIHQFAKVHELYAYDPAAAESWQERAKWLDDERRPAVDREQWVHNLEVYNQKLGNTAAAFASLQLLRRPETLAVVGGQQAGLFTGPLLVIYKAITIIQTAASASQRLKRPVVPVFWIAGEDHDFDEANHMYTLTPQLEIDKIKIDHPSGTRTSMSRLLIANWDEALQQLDASLMQTEFKQGLMEKLREIGQQSETLVDFFGKVLVWLFGRYGLVMIDSDDAGIRQAEGAMFARLVKEHEKINDALIVGKNKLEALGYTAQTEIARGNANLFHFDDQGERVLLQWDGVQFADKKRERTYPQETLLDWAVVSPERLSNNVMTRPLMQEYLFPVLATVLGPGEIAYWGLTRAAFEAVGMRMPIIIPRLEFTLLEGTTQKHMDKYALSVDDVIQRFEEKKANWLKAQDTLDLSGRFTKVKDEFNAVYDPLVQIIGGINPGMKKLAEANVQKIMEQIQFLETRSTEANQAQFEASIRQLERIRLTMLPLGKPQERVFNIFAYLNKYGDGWLHELTTATSENNGMHQIVYL